MTDATKHSFAEIPWQQLTRKVHNMHQSINPTSGSPHGRVHSRVTTLAQASETATYDPTITVDPTSRHLRAELRLAIHHGADTQVTTGI